MKDKKQQPTVSEDEINDLIQPHAITLEHGEKAAKDIFELLNRDEYLNIQGDQPAVSEEEIYCKICNDRGWLTDEKRGYSCPNCGGKTEEYKKHLQSLNVKGEEARDEKI